MDKDIVKNVSNWLMINGNGLNQQEQSEFIAICEAYGLNPFKREIYAVKFGGKCQIVVGYETYIKRAEMSGKLAGWQVWTEGEGQDMFGHILIYRIDWKEPFKLTLRYSECRNSKNQLWDSMPSWMLQVRTICRAFRLCFPDCAGMPYIEDEIVTIAKKTLRVTNSNINFIKSYKII